MVGGVVVVVVVVVESGEWWVRFGVVVFSRCPRVRPRRVGALTRWR